MLLSINNFPACVDPCAQIDCMRGSVCKVDPGTNQPFCEPSCDLANGGCAKDEFCQLNIVQCFTTPCPPEVECLQRDEVCSLPSESGPCKAFFRRFFHNPTTERCEQFIYGGCQGNANNFESLKECQMACGKKPYSLAPMTAWVLNTTLALMGDCYLLQTALF